MGPFPGAEIQMVTSPEFLLALSLAGFLVLVLGANNLASIVGTSLGARIIPPRRALLIAIVGVMSGLILEGPKLSNTISPRLLSSLSSASVVGAIAASLIILILATLAAIPLSLGQVAVGGAVGAGLAAGLSINQPFAFTIVASWALSPVVGFSIAFFLQIVLTALFRRVSNVLAINAVYARLTTLGSFYAAYVLGANTLGLVAGLIQTQFQTGLLVSLLLGVLTVTGMGSLGRSTARTVADNIVGLSPSAAMAAQLSGAFTVHLFTQLAIPISISQAVVGGILGAASTKSIVIRNERLVREIILGWILAPISGAALGFAITVFFAVPFMP